MLDIYLDEVQCPLSKSMTYPAFLMVCLRNPSKSDQYLNVNLVGNLLATVKTR
jgi:hypothetical protein